MYDVLVAGDYNMDLIFAGLARFPELGRDTRGAEYAIIPGEAYTSAVAMHRLGLKIGWAANFGNDDLSRMALEFVRREGLDESLFVHYAKPYRRVSAAASLRAERGFLTYYDPEPGPPAALKAIAMASARAFYIPGLYFGPFFNAGIKIIRLKRMKLIMDGNIGEDVTLQEKGVRNAIKSVDVFLPNAREARLLTGTEDLQQALRILGGLCPLVVIKDGERGAYAMQNGLNLYAPALRVTPVDTTGAGDCFSAGFVKAWLDGQPTVECLRWGCISGGLSTLALGGTGYHVSQRAVEERFVEYSLETR